MRNFISNLLHDTVSALAYSAASSKNDPTYSFLQPPYNDITRFLLHQRQRLPDYLRLPVSIATCAFDISSLIRAAGFFHSRAPEIRAKQIAAWKNSGMGFAKDMMRYYESLA